MLREKVDAVVRRRFGSPIIVGYILSYGFGWFVFVWNMEELAKRSVKITLDPYRVERTDKSFLACPQLDLAVAVFFNWLRACKNLVLEDGEDFRPTKLTEIDHLQIVCADWKQVRGKLKQRREATGSHVIQLLSDLSAFDPLRNSIIVESEAETCPIVRAFQFGFYIGMVAESWWCDGRPGYFLPKVRDD